MELLSHHELRHALAQYPSAKKMIVCYESGHIAFETDVAGVRSLAHRNAVEGLTKKGRFACVRLRVSIRAAIRILQECRPTLDDARKLTKPRDTQGMSWTPHYERAKLGRVGGFQTITTQGARLTQ